MGHGAATVARRRVKEAQATIGAQEFGETDLGYSIDGGPVIAPGVPGKRLASPGHRRRLPQPGSRGEAGSRGPSCHAARSPPARVPSRRLRDGRRPAKRSARRFGTVYRVRRDFDGRILAGKLFRKDPNAPYPEMADAALRQEVKALEALTHPNIVRVLGPIPVTTSGEWMIISEWIEGSTLDDYTSGPKAMTGPEAYQTGSQLLVALTYLESVGVVHRDIKPANVMIDEAGTVKLIDFNLTRETGLRTVVAGTPAYMPPDFLAQTDSADSFVDRFGVGVILYELIVGLHPYASYLADGRRPDLSAIPDDPRRLRMEVSADLTAFLVKGVAPIEADRFDCSE